MTIYNEAAYNITGRNFLMSRHGFTLIEMIVVMAIIGIVAGIAAPMFNSYMIDARLREGVRNLKSDMELAKIRAVRENAHVAVTFDTATDSYTIFIDNGAGGGTADDWVKNGGEVEIKTVNLPDDVDMYDVNFSSTVRIVFGGTGLPINKFGHCYMKNANDKYMGTKVTILGLISLVESKDGGATWTDME